MVSAPNPYDVLHFTNQRKFERFRLSALVPEGGVGESTVF